MTPVSDAVDAAAYRTFAGRLTRCGILSDPWLDDGRARFRERPVLLSAARAEALATAAALVTAVHDEAARLCAADPALCRDFLSLTPTQRTMWEACAPLWHGIARADVFETIEGPRVCELNSDTPSGEAEAVLLNEAARGSHEDPNVELMPRLCALVEAYAAELIRPPGPLTVGIVYPTDQVEDLSMVALYQRTFVGRGWKVVLGSPYNLSRHRHGAALFATRCDVFVRHYKTDWWSEREAVWRDAPRFADEAPLTGPLSILLEAERAGRCAVVNPFGAVVTQNKRCMALMWEARARFPAWARASIEAYVPPTLRLEHVDASVIADRSQWVLKSDYGCEGAEVIVGPEVDNALWQRALAEAVPGRWVAQRWFGALRDDEGLVTNHGVYVIGGEVAGFFSRVHPASTGTDALTAPTFIIPEEK